MKSGTLAGAAIGVPIVVVAVLSACSDPLRAGKDWPSEDPLSAADASAAETSTPLATLCISSECPAPYTTCADEFGLCTTNLSNDVNHCGSCDRACPSESAFLRASFVCVDSRCHMFCHPNTGDCNGLVDDGCEIDLISDPANCGACGSACPPGEVCFKGACGCPIGWILCDGRCVSISDDPENCGRCGNICGLDPSMVAWRCGEGIFPDGTAVGCINATCYLDCTQGLLDCNSNFCGDGCETLGASDTKNCGKCGKECADDQVCGSGKCLCDPGMARCSFGYGAFQCVDLASDAKNCGACQYECPGIESDTGSPLCEMGRCSYACAVGYANCDSRLENGCEVDVMVDPLHCGSCDTRCDVASGQPCAAGKCLTRPCDAGGVN